LTGGRAYLAATTTCAQDYRYETGACDSGGGVGGVDTGSAGAFFEGAAGTATGFSTGTGGDTTGFGTGEAGSTFPANGEAGVGGGAGDFSGGAGAAGSGGATAIDASAGDVISID